MSGLSMNWDAKDYIMANPWSYEQKGDDPWVEATKYNAMENLSTYEQKAIEL
jgi:hypothetical protein